MNGQLMAISTIEKYFFQFWVFWAKIDNAQNDPKMGNFHGTRTIVLKDTKTPRHQDGKWMYLKYILYTYTTI